MRRRPEDLAGATQISPTATPVDQFAITDAAALKPPVPREILDLAPFSNALAGVVRDANDSTNQELASVAEEVGRRVEAGDDINKVISEINESGGTPRAVASRMAKAVQSGKIREDANPFFVKHFHEARARVRALEIERNLPETQKQAIARALQNGTDDPEEVLFSAFQEAVEDSGAFDGLGYWGSRQLQADLTSIGQNFLNTASDQLNEERKRAVEADFDNQILSNFQQLGAALDGDDDKAVTQVLQKISASYSDLRLSGKAEHREDLVTAAIGAAQVIAQEQGEAEAAEVLREFEARVLDGTAKVFDGDLENSARLLTAAHILENRAQDANRKEIERRQSMSLDVSGRMDGAYQESLIAAAASSVDDTTVRAELNRIQSEIAADPNLSAEEKRVALEEWLPRKRSIWQKQEEAATQSDPGHVRGVEGLIRYGSPGEAQARLDEAASGDNPLINRLDYERLSREIELRRSGAWVTTHSRYATLPIPDPGNPLYDMLAGVGGRFVTQDIVNGRAVVNENEVGPEVQRLFNELEGDVATFAAQPSILELTDVERKVELDKYIQNWVNQKRAVYSNEAAQALERDLPGDAETRNAQEELRLEEVSYFNGQGSFSLGGYRSDPNSEETSELDLMAARVAPLNLSTDQDGTFTVKPGLRSVMDNLLTIDRMGLEEVQANRIKTDVLLRVGALSIEDVLSETTPQLPEPAELPAGAVQLPGARKKALARVEAMNSTELELTPAMLGSAYFPEIIPPDATGNKYITEVAGVPRLNREAISEDFGDRRLVRLFEAFGVSDTEENAINFFLKQGHLAKSKR